jgi:hypothetical protein
MSRCVPLLLISLLACGCHRAAADRPVVDGDAAVNPTDADFDIYEAALRHEVAQYSAQPNPPRVFYVSLDGDPPAPFLKRFTDGTARVEPMSRYGGGKEAGVALVVLHTEIQRTDADHVRVPGLTHYADEDLKCGTPYPISLVRKDGKWTPDRR